MQERMQIMMLAASEGIRAAVDASGVPEQTVYHWFSESGAGIGEYREFLASYTDGAQLKAYGAVYDEVIKRLGSMDNDELMVTFRKMIDAQTAMLAGRSGGGGAQAGAVVVNEIHVKLDGEDAILKR